MNNAFEKEFAGIEDGYREHSESTRPNLEVISKKRDEYLEKVIEDVIGKLDKNKREEIKRRVESSDGRYHKWLAEYILEDLYVFHDVNFDDIALSGSKVDAREKAATSTIMEVDDTYPAELIIQKLVEYFSKK